jgi:tetratricopeptide (TPR) repeat protein
LRYVLGLSEVYNRANYINLSEKYVNIGLSSFSKYPLGDFLKPYFISNRGKIFFRRNKFDLAINDLTSQLPIIKKNDDFSNYAENCFYIAECYNKTNQNDKAILYYKKVDSVFTFKKDIYPLTINSYEHLISYYKKNNDFKQVIYYSDQLIKADKILYENYRYLNSRILKNYDIKQVVSSKQATILSLKNENFLSKGTIFFLFAGVILLFFLLYLNNKSKKLELIKQKGNYSGCNSAIVLKAAKTFCPFLIQVSVTERMTA